ncbi:heterokaryon incompatibility protein-domain-containing protein [Xylaria palmicola]|nr:heterokaryon incompatibility protein-domain-containing protein [Xylaria palmicola]
MQLDGDLRAGYMDVEGDSVPIGQIFCENDLTDGHSPIYPYLPSMFIVDSCKSLGCNTELGNERLFNPEDPGAEHGDMPEPSDTDDDNILEAIFCSTCAAIFSESSYERSKDWGPLCYDPPSAGGIPFPGRCRGSAGSLGQSAQQDCYICSRIHTDVLFRDGPFSYRLREKAGGSYELSIGGGWRTNSSGVSRPDVACDFEIRLDDPVPTLEQLAVESRCRTWTGHNSTALVAKHWLTTCLRNHKNCAKPSLGGWKPSRLLDISEDKVRLVRGDTEEVQKQHYATLSHCWGNHEFDVLTAASMSQYTKGVNMKEFSRTFQETITTVRRLGIRYLWIDSYCIIQGSDAEAIADWEYESSTMGKVYSNSLLNIGALDSTDPTQGLFRSRSRTARKSRLLWSPTRQDKPRNFYITQTYGGIDMAFYYFKSSSLMRRGWVIQECVLAPRMLSFGSEVFWQCSQAAACEQYPDTDLPAYSRLIGHPFWVLGYLSDSHKDSGIDVTYQWLSALNTYCRSKLTYPDKDLFAAIDGIGTVLCQKFGGRFKHGMWDAALPEALLFGGGFHSQGGLTAGNGFRPTWHWSSYYPGDLQFNIYDIGSLHFQMVYAFMSDDCEPLPNETSKDFWPNLLLIGRLLREESLRGSLTIDASSGQMQFYLPVISMSSHFSSIEWLFGLTLVHSESGCYRCAGTWVVGRKRDGPESFDRVVSQMLKTRPQLIVLE